ncbi:MAG: mandelate racemase/muconate lactonizing enzyme family protein [Bacteroidetes bacterium]|nr:mandelate racemase/muconate lactonizing enzyme family protein [Bacteroidota bacterium]MCL5026128.1 mandelate racemase/muconate lactonizing enzyme family protein [Chloroflexota bacterium]
MKITDVQCSVLLDEHHNRDWVLVRVYTDAGLTGTGEAFPGGGVKEAVLQLRNMVIGEDPLDIDRLVQKMIRRIYTGGARIQAASGIEIALWDIAGKHFNCPVYNLLGGKYRDRIRVYGDAHHGDSLEDIAKASQEVVDEGYTAFKFDVDHYYPPEHMLDSYNKHLMPAGIHHIVAIAKTVREAVGYDIEFGMDCHWSYNVNDAVAVMNELETYKLSWFEDPVGPENVEAMLRVSERTRVPILTGENLYGLQGFRDLIARQAADILAPDVPHVGGILETRKIAAMADAYYIPLSPHNICSPVACMASVQLCAAIPNFTLLEIHSNRVPWYDDLLVRTQPIVQRGYITVPTGLGLGIELNMREAARHLKEGERLFD